MFNKQHCFKNESPEFYILVYGFLLTQKLILVKQLETFFAIYKKIISVVKRKLYFLSNTKISLLNKFTNYIRCVFRNCRWMVESVNSEELCACRNFHLNIKIGMR